MKKILAIALTLTLVFALAVSGSAATLATSWTQLLDANVTVDNSKLKNCWVYGEYSAFVLAMTEAEAAAATTTTQKAEQ